MKTSFRESSGVLTRGAIKAKETDRYVVPAVEQAGRVLFTLAAAASSHMSLTEICSAVGIHKSKAFSILHTLQLFGLVQRNIDGKGYSLGTGLITLSRRALDNLNVPRLAEPILGKLATEAGGTAILGLIADKSVFVAAKQEGERDIGYTIRIGSRFPLTYGSHGKAIAAFLPKEELARLLQGKHQYFHGKPEGFDRKKLTEELIQVHQDGFAIDPGDMKPGLISVAAPVLGPGTTPIGYIVVIGLTSEETARQFGPSVAEAARTLSLQLGAKIDDQARNGVSG
jgi:DNA-binding IclR family transcriptional regulator